MVMHWLSLLLGCAPPVPIVLSAMETNDPSVISSVRAWYEPGLGWQLEAELQLRNPSPTHRRRIDLQNVSLQVDGAAWQSCAQGAQPPERPMIVDLGPEDEKFRTLRCQDIRSPDRTLAMRMGVTNADSGTGVIILEYARVDQ